MPRTTPLALAACAALAAAAFSTSASAQEGDDARWEFRLSAFNPEASIGFGADGVATDGVETRDFDEFEEVSLDGKWRPHGELVFNMTDRQSLRANYNDFKRDDRWSFEGGLLDPGEVLPGEPPVEVPQVEVDARVKFALASLNYEYAVVQNEAFEVGLGLGITWADLEATGSATSSGTEEVDPEYTEGGWRQDGMSPNLHARIAWKPGERWRVQAQGQYLDTEWGDFLDEQGHFERAGVFVEYAVTPAIGVHVGYDWFRLELEDEYSATYDPPPEAGLAGPVNINGTARGEFKVHGPMAGVTFRF